MKISIVGAGGHGRVAAECLALLHRDSVDVVYYDDRYEVLESVDAYPVLGPALEACAPTSPGSVFVAIGRNTTRAVLIDRLHAAGKRLISIHHPSCILSPNARISEGTITISGAVVNRGARLGRGVIVNTLSSVGHDCAVQDFAQLGPGVNLGGGAVIQTGAFLGIGAKVAPEVTVGEWTVVGAGSIVMKDLPPRTFCFGSPARAVRELSSDELPSIFTSQ